MKKYTFRECRQVNLTDWFGLHRTFSSQILDSWLETPITPSEKEKDMVKTHQQGLLLNSDAWNEQELSLYFIGPIFSLAHFTEPLSVQPFCRTLYQGDYIWY